MTEEPSTGRQIVSCGEAGLRVVAVVPAAVTGAWALCCACRPRSLSACLLGCAFFSYSASVCLFVWLPGFVRLFFITCLCVYCLPTFLSVYYSLCCIYDCLCFLCVCLTGFGCLLDIFSQCRLLEHDFTNSHHYFTFIYSSVFIFVFFIQNQIQYYVHIDFLGFTFNVLRVLAPAVLHI